MKKNTASASNNNNNNYASSIVYGYPVNYFTLSIPPPPAAPDGRQSTETWSPPEPSKAALWFEAFCKVLLLITVLIGVTWFTASQTLDTSYVPDHQIESFSVTNLTISENQISAKWKIGLALTNRNPHVPVVYKEIKVSVFSSNAPGQLLSYVDKYNVNVVQSPKNRTVFYFKPEVWRVGLNGTVADSMSRGLILTGFIEFDVQVLVGLTFVHRFSLDEDGTLVMASKGILVAVSPQNLPPQNATGIAIQIPDLDFNLCLP